MTLLKKTKTAMSRLAAPDAPLLVGVSGGPDSVALLHALTTLGYRPHVCHFNHRWRGAASDADARFVRALAGKLGLTVSIGARTVAHNEDAARRARLAFFGQVARKTGIRTLALAHTADDQVETFLLRLLRGAGLTGLVAMRADRQLGTLRVIRPLLNVTRKEVLAYLAARKLMWRDDATNAERQFLRNRIRHELLPLLERNYNPGIRAVLRRTTEILRAEADREPAAWQRREIRRLLGAVSFDRVESVRRQLPVKKQWPINPRGATSIPELGMMITCRMESVKRGCGFRPSINGRTAGQRRMSEQFDAAMLGARLIIRTRRSGDRFQPLGMTGQKKLQDFFVDEKVSPAERDRVPLLCDSEGRIAWVVGYRMAEPFKVTNQTRRILRVRRVALTSLHPTGSIPATRANRRPMP